MKISSIHVDVVDVLFDGGRHQFGFAVQNYIDRRSLVASQIEYVLEIFRIVIVLRLLLAAVRVADRAFRQRCKRFRCRSVLLETKVLVATQKRVRVLFAVDALHDPQVNSTVRIGGGQVLVYVLQNALQFHQTCVKIVESENEDAWNSVNWVRVN